jgi:hypothetical protein
MGLSASQTFSFLVNGFPILAARGVPPGRHGSEKDGGASRNRTDDPLLAKQVLSQLSYGP